MNILIQKRFYIETEKFYISVDLRYIKIVNKQYIAYGGDYYSIQNIIKQSDKVRCLTPQATGWGWYIKQDSNNNSDSDTAGAGVDDINKWAGAGNGAINRIVEAGFYYRGEVLRDILATIWAYEYYKIIEIENYK